MACDWYSQFHIDEGNEEEESKMQDKEMEDNDEVLEEDGKDEDLEERHIDQDEGVTEKEHEGTILQN